MALTDLLKNVGRALTLTAALYSCGDTKNYYGNGGNGNSSEDFCQEYYRMCDLPSESAADIDECREYCNETSSPRDQPDGDCAFRACGVLLGICDTYKAADPREIIDCMREYGWDAEYN